VAIKQISRGEFSQFIQNTSLIYSLAGHPDEWYADETGNILGILGECRTPPKWFYAVLQRDDTGNFRLIEIKPKLENLDVARTELLRAMESA